MAGVLYVGGARHHLRGVPGGFTPPGLGGSGGPPSRKFSELEERKRDLLAKEQLIPASHMGRKIPFKSFFLEILFERLSTGKKVEGRKIPVI